jgi:hypothetical protein
VTYENLVQAEVIIRKLDRQFRKLTKFHSRYFFTHKESTSIQPTTPAERNVCWSAPTNVGTMHTLSTPMNSLKKSKDIETISKLIFKIIVRTKGLKRY